MRNNSVLFVLLTAACTVLGADPVRAQTVGQQLSNLLTEQTPPPPGYVRDMAAAQATFATVAGLLQVELPSIPVAASNAGFVYRFSPALATAERVSDSFGPFFAERALRSGEGNFSLGLAYQTAKFNSLQGADLESGTFPANAARFANTLQPFSVDTLTLELDMRTIYVFGNYGVTDRLDVGAVIPVSRLSFSGRRVNTFQGASTLQSSKSGSATGLGDIGGNVRYFITGRGATGVAVGADLRLPTGRDQDLLGAGSVTWRALGIGSWEQGRWAAHVNGGFGAGGVSREAFWTGAVTMAANARLSFVGELMGRRLSELIRVQDVYEPHPVLAGIDTMRWLPTESGIHTAYAVGGVKWNLIGTWLLKVNVLTRLTDAGFRGRVTPSIAIDRSVEF